MRQSAAVTVSMSHTDVHANFKSTNGKVKLGQHTGVQPETVGMPALGQLYYEYSKSWVAHDLIRSETSKRLGLWKVMVVL